MDSALADPEDAEHRKFKLHFPWVRQRGRVGEKTG